MQMICAVADSLVFTPGVPCTSPTAPRCDAWPTTHMQNHSLFWHALDFPIPICERTMHTRAHTHNILRLFASDDLQYPLPPSSLVPCTHKVSLHFSIWLRAYLRGRFEKGENLGVMGMDPQIPQDLWWPSICLPFSSQVFSDTFCSKYESYMLGTMFVPSTYYSSTVWELVPSTVRSWLRLSVNQ